MENNFLQWFNLKANGLIPILILTGFVMYFYKIYNPIGVAITIGAVILGFIYVIIELDDKARKSKRGY